MVRNDKEKIKRRYKKNTVVKRCLCCDVGRWSPSVRPTATAARCILAHAVATNRCATPSVPVDIAVVHDDYWFVVTANAVDSPSSVPASECADGE